MLEGQGESEAICGSDEGSCRSAHPSLQGPAHPLGRRDLGQGGPHSQPGEVHIEVNTFRGECVWAWAWGCVYVALRVCVCVFILCTHCDAKMEGLNKEKGAV